MTLKNTFAIRFYTSPPHPVGFGTTFLFSTLTTSIKLIKLTGKASLEGWGGRQKGRPRLFYDRNEAVKRELPSPHPLSALRGAQPPPSLKGRTRSRGRRAEPLGNDRCGGGTEGGREAEQEGGPRRRGGTAANLSQSAAGSRLGPCCPESGTPWLTVSRSQGAPRAPSGGSSAGREEASSPRHSLAS